MQFEGFSDLAGKRIALVASRAPWPTITGDRVRTIGMAEGLASRGAQVVVVCPEAPDQPGDLFHATAVSLHTVPKASRGLALLAGLVRATVRREPLQAALFPCDSLSQAVSHLHRQSPLDAVVVQLARIGPVARSLAQEMPVVLDMVDLLSLNFERRAQIARWPLGMLYALEAHRLRRLETALAAKMPVLLANEAEKTVAISNGAPESNVQILTNGVRSIRDTGERRDLDVMFSGNLSYEPNVRAVQALASTVAPALRQRASQKKVDIHIVGAQPNSLVKAAVAAGGLHLHANVPSMSAMLARSRLMVAPILAATGVQNKVLEAMASGCVPIVTPAAVSGIPGFLNGVHGLCLPQITDFPAAISQILENEDRWSDISSACRKFVESEYGWGRRVEPLAHIIRG